MHMLSDAAYFVALAAVIAAIVSVIVQHWLGGARSAFGDRTAVRWWRRVEMAAIALTVVCGLAGQLLSK